MKIIVNLLTLLIAVAFVISIADDENYELM